MAPKISNDKCTGCGTCASVCPACVFDIKKGRSSVARPDDCIECHACEASCPEQAISF
jgi:NAD-dependent dihydropyrimidine dehydrogenase PreA subunit